MTSEATLHTQTSTHGHGPDYCYECSADIEDYVKWPCVTMRSGRDGSGRAAAVGYDLPPARSDMTAVPTALIEALQAWNGDGRGRSPDHAIARIIACLPKPPPTFSDEVSGTFYKAMVEGSHGQPHDLAYAGRRYLTRLYESGWLTPTDDGSFIITPPKEPTDA